MPADRILIVEDDINLRKALVTKFRREGYMATSARDAREALDLIGSNQFAAAITDIRLPGEVDGFGLLKRMREKQPEMPVIMVTAWASIEGAVEALKLGAVDYLPKPFQTERLLTLLDRILGTPLKDAAHDSFKDIVTQDPQMFDILEQIRSVAPGNASVIICGETGTGKELVAKAIHQQSRRAASGEFVAVNCAAIPDTLLESEMFGHERGAFTNATARHIGRFERAHGGTLFLDEIAELSRELQAKLLRVLEEGEIERIGGSGPISVDVRIVASTHEDIDAMISSGRFREDLYFRLDVVTLELPPLRERPDDIPLLARHFLRRYAQEYNKEIVDFDPEAMEILGSYSWPGNVRHLSNIVEQAVVFCRDRIVQAEHVRPERRRVDRRRDSSELPIEVGMAMSDVERVMIQRTLEAFDGNRTKAAEVLGITPRTIRNKLKQYAEEEEAAS